jgi:hypothetical protein
VGEALVIVYISIGNSDDKLTQRDWSTFLVETDIVLADREVRRDAAYQVLRRHGNWRSLPDDPWQNACWCVEVEDNAKEELQDELRQIAQSYGQDSIAWAECPKTEFLS